MEMAVLTIADAIAPPEVWQYGVLGVVAFAFAFVIVKLFRISRTDQRRLLDAIKSAAIREKERDAERDALIAEHEHKLEQMDKDTERALKDNAEAYAKRVDEMREVYTTREDGLRNEFAVRMERIATEANAAATKQNEVLNKIYERFVGPRRGRPG